MTIPLPPTIPDPATQSTFNNNMYPFMQWMADAATTMNSIGNLAVRQQSLHMLQTPHLYDNANNATSSIVTGNTYYFPFYVLRPITLTALSVYKAVGLCKISIASELNGKPNTKLVGTAELTTGSIGYAEGAITSTTLYPNKIYFFGVATSTTHNIYYGSIMANLMPTFSDQTIVGNFVKAYCFKITETYANAFTTFTTFTESTEKVAFYSKGAYL